MGTLVLTGSTAEYIGPVEYLKGKLCTVAYSACLKSKYISVDFENHNKLKVSPSSLKWITQKTEAY